jgi:hypothetical protein
MIFGFKQIKEFNENTVTQEVAAELCAIAGLWNSYARPPHNTGFTIKNQYANGSLNGVDLTGQPDGIEIYHNSTRHRFRIWKDGRIQVSNILKEDDEWQIIHKKGDYERLQSSSLEYPCDQIEYAAKLCELGFYKFDLRKEKINRLLNK